MITAYDLLLKLLENEEFKKEFYKGEDYLDEEYEKLILDEDSSDDSTSTVILTEAIETHDTLNPALWDENDNLLPEVEEGINKIVDQFVSELKDNEVDLKVIDVVLVGSNASYNYTKDSDLDVHIVADTSIIDCNYGLLPIIYNMARSSFNNKYDISIHGVPIEIYVEGTDTQATSNGIYSMKDGWIKKPVRLDIPEVDISDLYPEWEERAKEILENEDTTIEDVDQFINDIYILRRNSIATDGEYGKGNLAFKEIRNNGYLDKLKDLKVKLTEKSMIIEDIDCQEELEETYFVDPSKLDSDMINLVNHYYKHCVSDEDGQLKINVPLDVYNDIANDLSESEYEDIVLTKNEEGKNWLDNDLTKVLGYKTKNGRFIKYNPRTKLMVVYTPDTIISLYKVPLNKFVNKFVAGEGNPDFAFDDNIK